MAWRAALGLFSAAQLSLVSSVRRKRTKAAAPVSFKDFIVLRATPQSEQQFDLLDEENLMKDRNLTVDFWNGPTHVGEPVTMMVSGTQAHETMEFLRANNIAFETSITDVQAAIDASMPGPSIAGAPFSYETYHTLDEVEQWVLDTVQRSSDLENIKIGKTGQGRDVLGLKINGGAGKPIIVMVCGVHSREWVSPASCLWVANKLITGQAGSDMDAFEWHIVPVTNSDGYEHTWNGNRMWRKTRSPKQGFFCTEGVDPNRNWDFNHCQERGERNCIGDAYCGKEAFSEPEVLNIANYMRGLIDAGKDVRSFLDIHSFSQMWLWPWGYTSEPPADIKDMDKCGNAAADATAAVYDTWWRRGSISKTIYKCGGTSLDWLYENLGIKYAYALELRDTGRHGFLLPPDQIAPACEEFMAGLKALASCMLATP